MRDSAPPQEPQPERQPEPVGDSQRQRPAPSRARTDWSGEGPQPPGGPSADAEPHWRVAPGLPGLKLAGAAGLILIGVLFGDDAVRLALAGTAALALVVWGARDVIAPVRVSADPTGVTVVTGYAGRRTVPWERIERIRVDTRSRLGLRTETLEIDAGEALYLFSPYDLGAPPAEVAARLTELSRAAR